MWPKVQKAIVSYIQSEEYQKKFVTKINKKMDIPNLDEAAEAKLLNQVYDAAQDAGAEIVRNIDVESILKKID